MERREAPPLSGKEKIQRLLHQWHEFYDNVGDATRVYYVGADVASLKHVCPKNSVTLLTVGLEQPAHAAVRAGMCARCNRVWIAEEAPSERASD